MTRPKITCPICKHEGILLGEEPVVLMGFDLEKNAIHWDQGHPLGLTVCENCGHADLYSLRVLEGIKNAKETERKQAAAESKRLKRRKRNKQAEYKH